MSHHEAADWIVCYDIARPRNWRHVYKLLQRHGVPLQYSVFLVRGTQAALVRLVRDIGALICAATDDVRAYRVPLEAACQMLGGTRLPDGVLLGVDLPGRAACLQLQPAPAAGSPDVAGCDGAHTLQRT